MIFIKVISHFKITDHKLVYITERCNSMNDSNLGCFKQILLFFCLTIITCNNCDITYVRLFEVRPWPSVGGGTSSSLWDAHNVKKTGEFMRINMLILE